MEIKGSLENALKEIDVLRSKMSELSGRNDIHQIELDLLLKKLRDLYDFLSSLEPSMIVQEKNLPLGEKPSRYSRKPDKIKHTELFAETGFMIDNAVESAINSGIQTDAPGQSEKEQLKSVHPAGKSEAKNEFTTEKPSETKRSVHELHSETSQKKNSHIGTVIRSKPIQNIEDAIGVNDKFLFIRELFGSNTSLYKETIEALNNATDFNSAYNYIENKFEWDTENEAAQKLLDLVRRRHISH